MQNLNKHNERINKLVIFHERRFSSLFTAAKNTNGTNCVNAWMNALWRYNSVDGKQPKIENSHVNIAFAKVNLRVAVAPPTVRNRMQSSWTNEVDGCERSIYSCVVTPPQRHRHTATATTIYLSISRWMEKRTAFNLIFAGSGNVLVILILLLPFRVYFHLIHCSFNCGRCSSHEHTVPKQNKIEEEWKKKLTFNLRVQFKSEPNSNLIIYLN